VTFPPKVWDDVLRRLDGELPASVLETWLGPVVARPSDDGLELLCPSQFHCDRVRSVVLAKVVACVSEIVGEPARVTLEVADPATAARAVFEHRCESDAREAAAAERGAAPAHVATPVRAEAPSPDVPQMEVANAVSQLVSALSDERSEPPARVLRSQASPRPQASTARVAPQQRHFAYTFDNFVVGPCNALAREASLAMARREQDGLQQLYLNSQPGLGKTHLCRAAAAEVQRVGAERVLYTSAEDFTTAFTTALRAKQTSRFKQRFRKDPRVLVVEDVHFFAGKKQTQLEFFHTVRHVLDAGGRVVLTGDRLPKDLVGLEECVQSQLQSGFVAELEPPDASVRRDILRAKAARGGVHLPDDCLDLLVESVRGSVRELEGVLIQLVTTASLMKKRIDLALTREALSKKIKAPEREIRAVDVRAVLQTVALFFKTTPEAMAARSRRRDVVVPRQLAMYLCRRFTNASLSEIGAALDRNHPAVRNAITKTERAILERAPLRYQVEALTDRLNELSGR
jgi:chromosomal replication initiator protein